MTDLRPLPAVSALRNLRGDGSDQLWPFSTGSTYQDNHDLVSMARLLELPEKFLSNRLRVSEILNAVGIWLMRRALALNIAIGNRIIDRLPSKFKT